MASVVEEDINSYSTVLNQFPQELNIGQVNDLSFAANILDYENCDYFQFFENLVSSIRSSYPVPRCGVFLQSI